MASYWRDSLRPACFRGVSFEVQSRELQGGRRIIEHTYPQRDESTPEDLGRKPRRWKVDAFLVSPSYLADRDRLLDVLEQEGPGDYIDPWGDSHRVVCASFSMKESLTEGGVVHFSIEFQEAPDRQFSNGSFRINDDTCAPLLRAAAALSLASLNEFMNLFCSVSEDDILNDILRMARTYTSFVQGLVRGQWYGLARKAGTTPDESLFSAAMTMAGAVSEQPVRGTFSSDFSLLLSNSLAAAVAALPSPSTALGAEAHAQGLAYLSLFRQELPVTESRGNIYIAGRESVMAIPYISPASTTLLSSLQASPRPLLRVSQRLSINREIVSRLVEDLIFSHRISCLAQQPLATSSQAQELRQSLVQHFDQRLEQASDNLYMALKTAKGATLRDIDARSATLIRSEKGVLAQNTPSLALSYRLTGDAGRESELLSLNPRIQHPGFVPGGCDLTLLSGDIE